MIGVSLNVYAQTTKQVKGAVIDKNGNPLPGAKVEATGGAESTVTDADGTFSIEVSQWLKSLTATYNGMKKKKMDIRGRNDVLFELKNSSNLRWFVNLSAESFVAPAAPSLGLMFGQMGNWGWYTKFLVTYEEMEDVFDDAIDDIEGFAITAGAIKRIKNDWFAYGGLGYGAVIYEDNNNNGWGYYNTSVDGGKIELGSMFRFNHFDFNIGLTCVTNFSEINWGPQLGVGYAF